MKKLNFLTQVTTSVLSILFLAAPVLAATNTINIAPEGELNMLRNITIPNVVPVIIRVVLIVAALVALVFLVIGGIKWITSGGDKTQLESARGTITNALIGLVIVFAAWAIIRLIELFFNIKILSLNIPNIAQEPY